MSGDVIFLDVGGIILEIDWQHSFRALGLHAPEAQQEAKKKINACPAIYEYERGKISRVQFIMGLAGLLGRPLSTSMLQDLAQNPSKISSIEIDSAFNKLIVGPLTGAEQIFDRYSGKVPVCALSNTNEGHHAYQQAQFPILQRFDRFFASFEMGHRKPDPEIFELAATAMGIRPAQGIFIDDSLANVEAARRVGFRAHHSVNSPTRTLEILKQELGF